MFEHELDDDCKNLETVRIEHAVYVLKCTGGNLTNAALSLGMSIQVLCNLLKKAKELGYDIPRPGVKTMEEIELDYIVQVLEKFKGSRIRTAKALQISERKLFGRLEKARLKGYEDTCKWVSKQVN